MLIQRRNKKQENSGQLNAQKVYSRNEKNARQQLKRDPTIWNTKFRIIISNQNIMAEDNFSKLTNNMAYGTITRSELPGDIEDYNVTLIREFYKSGPPSLKLKFTLAKKDERYQSNFYVKIDDVRDPANPIILIKYSENEGKISAKASSKIKKKMILSVEKEIREHEDLVEDSEEEEDSDIPRGKPLIEYLAGGGGGFDDEDPKPRKRVKPNNQQQRDDDQSS